MAQLTGGLWEAGLRSGTALGARDRARRHLGQFGTYGEHELRLGRVKARKLRRQLLLCFSLVQVMGALIRGAGSISA